MTPNPLKPGDAIWAYFDGYGNRPGTLISTGMERMGRKEKRLFEVALVEITAFKAPGKVIRRRVLLNKVQPRSKATSVVVASKAVSGALETQNAARSPREQAGEASGDRAHDLKNGPPNSVLRACLDCGRNFWSASKGNRICPECKRRAKFSDREA